jgi:hypothetical protein
METLIARLAAEGLLSTDDLAARLMVHPATVRRWVVTGAAGRGGTRVRLECVRTPGRIRSTLKAVERFLTAVGQGGVAESVLSTSRTPAKRNKADEQAARQLEAMGI